MTKTRLALSILTILLGILIFIYGGYDDSPGAQLLGLILVIIGIVKIIKSNRKTID
ncbi:MAG: hypothetical protein QG579_287 [Patescibacteria group bacterium]|jgi:uncharacterized membrane protein HdeD (DUF308 family)|nr:hypothetical protein [Patescibacteria group bacterium]